ncbi:MAG: DNA polymerase III subunit delta' [Nitrospirales bacterium]|nr:DNA polymerase III subunit delta' [Nitrospirales bacterium]
MTFREIQGHQRPIRWLQHAVASNHLGHAYLFHGEEAIGKRLVALALTKFLHCERPIDDPLPDACGDCRACHQIAQGTHPDFLSITTEDEQKQNPKIKIDQIRALEHFVIYRPLVAIRKICLIDHADTMTVEAVNALLKTLEDPPDHCIFLLTSSRPEHMLATIRSRCMTMKFSPLSLSETSEFLRTRTKLQQADRQLLASFSEGRLGKALQITPEDLRIQLRQYWALLFGDLPKSPSTIMDMCEDLVKSDQVREAIRWFRFVLRELLLVHLNREHRSLFFPDQTSALLRLSETIDLSDLLDCLNELEKLERGQQRNVNMQLGLEQFFFHLQDHMGNKALQEA